MIKTRFAPSPTGHLHIGGLRTALYNFLFARHNGGKFILRIEDTDKSREVGGAREEIIDVLNRFGLKFDGKPYVQSERLDIYHEYAEKLIKNDFAYWCNCSPARLDKSRKEQMKKGVTARYDGRCRIQKNKKAKKQKSKSVLRLQVPKDRTVVFKDIIRGEISFQSADIDDQVLLKSDGMPTYHLANVVDDHLMKITHVIRGEEWLSSTPKHVLLYEMFGWELPEFAHLPLILSKGGGKLSKRAGHASALDYLKGGYLPEAIINFLALLGWNPRADQEIYTLDELIKEFDLKKVNKGGAVFSEDKLDWIAGEHMKKADPKRLTKFALASSALDGKVRVRGKKDLVWLSKVMQAEQQRISKLSEVGKETDFAFVDKLKYPAGMLVWKKSNEKEARERLEMVQGFLSRLGDKVFTSTRLEKKLLDWIATNDLGNAETLWPLRVALTGREKSPSPFEAAAILGKKETLRRIGEGIKKL